MTDVNNNLINLEFKFKIILFSWGAKSTSFPGSLTSALSLGARSWLGGLVGVGYVTTCDINFCSEVESVNNFCQSQLKRKEGDHWSLLYYATHSIILVCVSPCGYIWYHAVPLIHANTPLKFYSPMLSFTQVKIEVSLHPVALSPCTIPANLLRVSTLFLNLIILLYFLSSDPVFLV